MALLLYMPEFLSTIMLESSCLFLITSIIFYLIFVLQHCIRETGIFSAVQQTSVWCEVKFSFCDR